MEFETQRISHIYNRGNNRQTIFFTRDNYLFFLKKIRKYLLPYGNILAWCLMPNHFHLMIEVLSTSTSSEGFTQSETFTDAHQSNTKSDALNDAHPRNTQSEAFNGAKHRSLNDSIGIMLRSYTRAVNKERGRTGAIFQQKTKAKCLNDPEFAPAYFNTAFGMIGNIDVEGMDYLSTCFRYIHLNPLHHKLIQEPEEWEFSSFRDIYGKRNGSLVNIERVIELGLFDNFNEG